MQEEIKLFRRFARTLAGSRKLGDAVIDAAVQQSISDQVDAQTRETAAIRTIIARRLLDIWSESSKDLPKSARRTPAHHAAFLLHALEGFSADQVADAMGTEKDEAKALIKRANNEIRSQLSAATLIIEDDIILATEMAHLIQGMGHTIIGIARSKDEAIKYAQKNPPQLILSDVELYDGSSGVQAVRALTSDREIPAIFVTGHPEQVLEGDLDEATYLLSKPHSRRELGAIIYQALFFQAEPAKREDQP